MFEDPAAGFGMCSFDGSFTGINPVKVEGFQYLIVSFG
jgi:hypothetical protein